MELLEKVREKWLTYVGTLQRNKREIPIEFLPNKTRKVGSVLFDFTKQVTIFSQVPKKQKIVILLSSILHEESYVEQTGKQEIIIYFNGGVDALDEKCFKYSTSHRTRRWLMVIFFVWLTSAV